MFGLTKDGKVDWPKNPKEGQTFSYVDPIGGSDWVHAIYRKGKWAAY